LKEIEESIMRYLTRQEELVLLSVFRLKKNAYLVSIQDHLNQFTGKNWSISSVYIPLSRLEKKGYLGTSVGEVTEKRGGKAIKYYQMTKTGLEALSEIEVVNETMWKGVKGLMEKLEKT
jgi:DNA-binding PadR family transcriptional regulator